MCSDFPIEGALPNGVYAGDSGDCGAALSCRELRPFAQTLLPVSYTHLNRVTSMSYPGLKRAIEAACGVRVYGYLPACPECALESRHLGLVTAQEVKNLREKMDRLAEQAERSLDLDGIVALMRAQEPLEAEEAPVAPVGHVRVAVARDRAFCFYSVSYTHLSGHCKRREPPRCPIAFA